jgi:hypothetical protein
MLDPLEYYKKRLDPTLASAVIFLFLISAADA